MQPSRVTETIPQPTQRPSVETEGNDQLKALTAHPDFKRLVHEHALLLCRQTVAKRARLTTPQTVFRPRVDVVDDPLSSRIVATFELPGVKPQEITIGVRDGVLFINGRRRPQIPPPHLTSTHNDANPTNGVAPQRTIRVPIQELRYGQFQRNVIIPAGVKENHITARFNGGMLIVTWPRSSPSNDGDVEMPNASNNDNDSGIISIVPNTNAEETASE